MSLRWLHPQPDADAVARSETVMARVDEAADELRARINELRETLRRKDHHG